MYRIIRVVQLMLCLVLVSPAVYAELSFKALGAIVQMPENLEGGFTQEKYLAALEASLISTGKFSYHENKLINWITLTPIKSSLLLTPDSISDESGAELSQGSDVLSNVLFSVLTANWAGLSNYFDMSGSTTDENWQVILNPRDATIASVIERIELGGNRFIRELTLYDRSGDYTKIIFKHHDS